jgi:4-oxalocrotonate tautomerase family enzyme
MPLAQLYIGPGRSESVRQQLIQNVSKAIQDTLGPLQQPVWVIINEVPLNQWGVDGVPVKPLALPASGG